MDVKTKCWMGWLECWRRSFGGDLEWWSFFRCANIISFIGEIIIYHRCCIASGIVSDGIFVGRRIGRTFPPRNGFGPIDGVEFGRKFCVVFFLG